jgi:serine/threonine protein kinase
LATIHDVVPPRSHGAMAAPTWLDGGMELEWRVLSEDAGRVLARVHPVADAATTALIVRTEAERSRPELAARLANELSLRDYLDESWAARPAALVREADYTSLVVEDPGGELLASEIGEPMHVRAFLERATALSRAIADMHHAGLLHKDIKPDNVLVGDSGSRVWLTGFGIASRLPRERQSPAPPEIIAGSLPYMAPEQTGRMNRSIDTRSDFYALGVTLYQMLTGVLPFSASNAMEWIGETRGYS